MQSNQDLHHYAYTALQEIGEEGLAASFKIHYNPRMRSAAGRAILEPLIVEINPKLLPFGEAEVKSTIRHELAHLLAWVRHTHRGHGPAWRQACVDLGIPNESVTHTLPLPSNRQRRQWRYRCKHCQYEFDRVRRVKRTSACAKCCKELNKGKFSARFLLDEFRLVYK